MLQIKQKISDLVYRDKIQENKSKYLASFTLKIVIDYIYVATIFNFRIKVHTHPPQSMAGSVTELDQRSGGTFASLIHFFDAFVFTCGEIRP